MKPPLPLIMRKRNLFSNLWNGLTKTRTIILGFEQQQICKAQKIVIFFLYQIMQTAENATKAKAIEQESSNVTTYGKEQMELMVETLGYYRHILFYHTPASTLLYEVGV